MTHKAIFLIALLLCIMRAVFSQETIGVPAVSNYPQEETRAGAQSWQIAQDKTGYLHFANNSGLLTYNNKEWKLTPLPNKTIVRSLVIAPDGKIYAGGQDIFGYFYPDSKGQLVYHSLLHKIAPEDRAFGDVWNMVIYKGEIFCRTSRTIFRYNTAGNSITTKYPAPGDHKWSFMEVCNNTLYAQNGFDHLVIFDGEKWVSAGAGELNSTLVMSVMPYHQDTVLVATFRNGMFLLCGKHTRVFNVPANVTKAQIYTARPVNDSSFAVGTVSAGIFFIDRKGNTTRHFYTGNGMQNNNVLSLFIDDQQNMWAGLDEGIDRIDFNSAIKIIPPGYQEKLAVYAMRVVNNTLYAGTSDGVFASKLTIPATEDISLSTNAFTKIKRTDGQAWNLSENNGDVLIGHHDGALLIIKDDTRLLAHEGGGTWLFRSLRDGKSMITGTYAGIQSLQRLPNGFQPGLIPGNTLKESLRFVEIDFERHVVWASHPYRGVYKIQMSPDFTRVLQTDLLTSKQGLPGELNNFVFRVNNEIVFATEKGVYRYNRETGLFNRHETLSPVFGNMGIKFMTSDPAGRIWFATEKRIGVLENNQLRFLPELDGMLIAGFENIYPLNDENIFICGYKGIIHLNYKQYSAKKNRIKVWLSKVNAIGRRDSLLFNGYFVNNGMIGFEQHAGSTLKLAPQFNSFHFEYAANQFGSTGAVQYSYQLQGLGDEWSAWTEKTEKDYTNLSHGSYSFKVKARDNLGNESAVISYSFRIAPRWYQTNAAYIIYLLILLLLIWGANRIHYQRMEKQRIQFEKEEAQLKHLHELEKEHSEKEIIKLKNERLETEVNFKNKELATTTMHLYKRGRLLGKIKQELADATRNLKTKEERLHFDKLVKLIIEEEKRDNDWEQFAIHFDQVHNKFLQRFKQRYPELTPADLKISAYIKMNLSSKEIAQLLNVSLKAVEIARYRLRKKLQLDPNINLTEFIMSMS